MFHLSGKAATVSGAGSFHGDDSLRRQGKGGATARLKAGFGAAVVPADLNGEAAERRAASVRDERARTALVESGVGIICVSSTTGRMGELNLTTYGIAKAGYGRRCDRPYLGEPEDPAAVVALLASGASQYVRGEVIHVDGGFANQFALTADSRVSGLVAGP